MRVIAVIICIVSIVFNILSQNNRIKYPDVPENIILKSERINYICVHFWDNTTFEDANILDDIKGFKDFVYLLTHVSDDSIAQKGVANLLTRCMSNNEALSRVDDILKQYFDNSYSIYQDEDMYLMILHELLKLPLNELYKIKVRFRIDMAMKNKVGNLATNFSYSHNNKTFQLYDISSPYLLIYFNSSDCHVCEESNYILEKSESIKEMISAGKMKILSIDITGDNSKQIESKGWIYGYNASHSLDEELLYYIEYVPVFYLLDKDKRVILKNVSINKIISYIENM